MKEIRTEITIHAKPQKVWDVLNDFESYQNWNPFILSISGEKKIDGVLSVQIKPPASRAMTFEPKVLEYKPNREFRWLGKLLIKGIFDGEHYFILEENDDESTTFIHGEKFSGFLIPFLSKSFIHIEEGFTQMNQTLKKECEKHDPL